MGYWNLSLCEMSYNILLFVTTVRDVKNFQKKVLTSGNVWECAGMCVCVILLYVCKELAELG